MRAAAILGLGSSSSHLRAFQNECKADWLIGQPTSAEEADVIVLFGGDGTLHRHLSQLVRLRLPVLVVPVGSGNDFARALRLTRVRHSLAAWKKFASGDSNVRTIDLGLVTAIHAGGPPAPHTSAAHPRYFCCVAGVGLDTEVARLANRLPRWLRGHGGYVLSLPPALLRFTPRKIQLNVAADGDEIGLARHRDPLLLAAFANAPWFGGGMRIAPRALLDDGNLDVCLVSQLPLLKLARLFPTVYFGRHVAHPAVTYFQTARLQLQTEPPAEIYADGEYVCQTPAEISVAPGALQVVTR